VVSAMSLADDNVSMWCTAVRGESVWVGCGIALIALNLCRHLPLAAWQAPSGFPPDVSSRVLDICVVLDACEGLDIEEVIAAAERELKPLWSPGEHQLSRLMIEIETDTASTDAGGVGASGQGFGLESRRQGGRVGASRGGGRGCCLSYRAQVCMMFACTTKLV